MNTVKRRKKADASKIKKAQTHLKQAYNLIKDIVGHEELDQSKHMLLYMHKQMGIVTLWLDGTEKPALNPVETIETELENEFEVAFRV